MSLYQNVFIVYYCLAIFDKLIGYYKKYVKKQTPDNDSKSIDEETVSIEKNIREMFEQQENKLTEKLEQLQKMIEEKERK